MNADRSVVVDYWRARGERAIATRLLSTYLILETGRERLRLTRSTIAVLADLASRGDAERVRRLGHSIARYYHGEGELARCATRLGEQLDRRSATVSGDVRMNRASRACRVLTFGLKRHMDADDRSMTWA